MPNLDRCMLCNKWVRAIVEYRGHGFWTMGRLVRDLANDAHRPRCAPRDSSPLAAAIIGNLGNPERDRRGLHGAADSFWRGDRQARIVSPI